MITKPCKYTRCHITHANEGQYCDVHAKKYSWTRTKIKNPFYDRRAWRITRAVKLANDPECEVCHNALATEVHHIVKLEDDLTLAYEMSNLQSLCKACHSRETQSEITARRYAKTVPTYKPRGG